MKIYTRNNKPDPSPDDPSFSVNVIALSEDGLLNIGFFHFEDDRWYWHTDTLVNMDEIVDGKPVQFNWIYAPKELIDSIK